MSGESAVLVPLVGAASYVAALCALGDSRPRTMHRGAPWAGDALSGVLARFRCVLPTKVEDVGPDIPVMLDVVTLGLSAGLSFDSSLELYCDRYHNALSRALRSERLRWQLGAESRADGLRALASDFGQPVLSELAGVVEESLELGRPLAGALEREAGQLRAEQRARTEERIEQVPVRMLIPLGTLIVPAMLLAILGPLLGSAVGVG